MSDQESTPTGSTTNASEETLKNPEVLKLLTQRKLENVKLHEANAARARLDSELLKAGLIDMSVAFWGFEER